MKAVLTLLAFVTISSTSHAVLQEHYKCQTPDLKVKFWVNTFNNPTFDLATYDSTAKVDELNEGGVELMAAVDGDPADLQVKMTAAAGGVTTPTLSKSGDQTCETGYEEASIMAKANVVLGGKTSSMNFVCTKKVEYPSGAVMCE